jgi:ankyrin repeat protein
MSPLHLACKRGFLEIVELLLDHGADQNCISRVRESETVSSLTLFRDPEAAVRFNSLAALKMLHSLHSYLREGSMSM